MNKQIEHVIPDQIINAVTKVEEQICGKIFILYGESAACRIKNDRHLINEETARNILTLLYDQDNQLSQDTNIYFMIQSKGGNFVPAIQIIDAIKKRYKKFYSIVHTVSASAGAIISLSSQTLYMRGQKSSLSDFGPANLEEDILTPEKLEEMYSILRENIQQGTFEGLDDSKLDILFAKLGFPIELLKQVAEDENSKSLVEVHGQPVFFDTIKQFSPEKIMLTSHIQATNDMQYIADSFQKIDIMLRKYMKHNNIAEIGIYNTKYFQTSI